MKKNQTLKENFTQALQAHRERKFKNAEILYKKILKIDPNHFESIFYLASLSVQTKNFDKAKQLFQKALQIRPNHAITCNNLGLIFQELGEYKKAINSYKKAIKIRPDLATAHNNLGLTFEKLEELQKATNCYQKAIQIDPHYSLAHYNFGNILKKLGKYTKATNSYKKAIEIRPNFAAAHNNLGDTLSELGEHEKAISCYQKAIQIKPDYSEAYWNLHSFASNIDEALNILKKLYKINNKFTKAKIMISALQGFQGNFNDFEILTTSPESKHPYTRSIKWVFSQPKLPKIYFNRWSFYDGVVVLAEKTRPFYEFGVWNGISFQYLIKTFKKGFGFDTFTGLPESWNDEAKGTYSSFGIVPKIKGGKFIVGKFADTLPKFFSKKKPLASIINFDADLYSSTLCALNYSNKVIDEKSILIFDEFLMNKNWEQDEYKALKEFCNNFNFAYDVLAVSLFSKQIAIKLKKN